MKRRTFLLGGGLLASLSLGATATNAAISDTVASAANFQVIADVSGEVSSFTIDPTTENTDSQHTWEFDITSDENIDRIEADYDFDTDAASFDPLTDADITVEFYDATTGSPGFEPVTLATADYNDSTATFDITSTDADIDGQARVVIGGDVSTGDPGVVNPGSGTYEPELRFVQADGDSKSFTATMTTSTGDGFFEVSNLTVSTTSVDVGDGVTFSFDVTNTGAGTDTRNIDLNLDRGSGFTNVDTQGVTLDPSETKSKSFTYTAQSQDKPDFVGEVAGDTSTPPQTPSISVTGGWSLTLTNSGGQRSIHTWSTDGIDFSEDVDTITVRYPSGVFKKSLEFNETNPTVTIDLTNTANVSYTETISNGGHTATWDLADGSEDTSISGSASIEIDDLRDPKQAGTYEPEIELKGVNGERYTATQTFTV